MESSLQLWKEFPRKNDYFGIHPAWPGIASEESFEIKMFAGGQKYGWSLVLEENKEMEINTCHKIKTKNCSFHVKICPILEEWNITLKDSTANENENILLKLKNNSGLIYEFGRQKPFWLFSIIVSPVPKRMYYFANTKS